MRQKHHEWERIGKSNDIRAEIEARFGFFPPFFAPAFSTPQMLEYLWQQTLFAYVDNPLPALFKEKLSAYLSRYCSIPYCLICHSCSLVPLGMQPSEVLALLIQSQPNETDVDTYFDIVKVQLQSWSGWTNATPVLEEGLIFFATLIFLDDDRAKQAQAELRQRLEATDFQYLVMLISYIKTCHRWVEAHPEISYEADERVQRYLIDLEANSALADFFQNYRKQVEHERRCQAVQLAERLERQQAEADRERFMNLTNSLLCTAGFDGYFKRINPAWEKIVGFPEAELLTTSCFKFVHPEDVADTLAQLQGLMNGIETTSFEHRWRCKDGSYKWLSWNIVPFPEQELLYCVAHDISRRKRAEEALRQSQEQLERIFETLPSSIVIMNHEGKIISANARTEKVLGCSLDEIVGRTYNDLAWHITSLDGQAFPEGELPFERVIQSGVAVYGIEHTIRRSDGTCAVLFINAAPLHSAEGDTVGVIASISNITERKQHEEYLRSLTAKLQQQNEQLQEVSRLKSEFLTNMSHELRTPLTSILGFSSVLLKQSYGPLNPKQEQYVTLVHSSGQHLLDLINDLLDLAKIEAGKLELSFETFDLAELCQEALRIVEISATAKQQQICLEQPVACETLMGDRQRIMQVLLNYLSNAVKFTPEGGRIALSTRLALRSEFEAQHLFAEKAVQLSPHGSPTSCYLVLSVSDTGIGIAVEQQHLLFQTFQQLDGDLNRRCEGTGLGLALTRRLVELHGGKVGVTSTSEDGSTFSAWFPIMQESFHSVEETSDLTKPR